MASARIASLDGLRALSIAFVFVAHSASSTGFGPLERYCANFGRLGVWIFFVISGFIITLLLLREADRRPISLKNFYLRRALRLVPALLTYLAFLAILQSSGFALGVAPINFLSSALFLVPYLPWGAENHPWSTGGLWSLAVEEHFYLLWPPLLVWFGIRRAKLVLVGFIVVTPLCRILWYKLRLDPLGSSLLGVADLMAFGAVGAIWHHKRPEQLFKVLSFRPVLCRCAALSVTAGIFALWINHSGAFFTVPMGMSMIGLSITYLVLSVSLIPGGLIWRLLNAPIIVWVGGISYSMYIWNSVFLHKYTISAPWWQQFPANLALAMLAAVACHYFVERPFLSLKSRFQSNSA